MLRRICSTQGVFENVDLFSEVLDINVEMNKIETVANESTLALFIIIRSIFVGIGCLCDKLYM